MYNIELRLLVEKNRREEALFNGNYRGGRNTLRKTVLNIMNHFPTIMPKELNYTKLFSKY